MSARDDAFMARALSLVDRCGLSRADRRRMRRDLRSWIGAARRRGLPDEAIAVHVETDREGWARLHVGDALSVAEAAGAGSGSPGQVVH